MEKIKFETDNGVEEFYVIDETRISGRNYILVSDSLEDEADAICIGKYFCGKLRSNKIKWGEDI